MGAVSHCCRRAITAQPPAGRGVAEHAAAMGTNKCDRQPTSVKAWPLVVFLVAAGVARAADAAPAISVSAPHLGAVARPGLAVHATCADPAACIGLEVRVGGATGPV